MPRYFFDLQDDIDAPDPDGKELADLDTAIVEALKDARELIGASVERDGTIDLRHHINIRDGSGVVVYTLWFENALRVRRGDRVISEPSFEA